MAPCLEKTTWKEGKKKKNEQTPLPSPSAIEQMMTEVKG
jgi:hypothetical protein